MQVVYNLMFWEGTLASAILIELVLILFAVICYGFRRWSGDQTAAYAVKAVGLRLIYVIQTSAEKALGMAVSFLLPP